MNEAQTAGRVDSHRWSNLRTVIKSAKSDDRICTNGVEVMLLRKELVPVKINGNVSRNVRYCDVMEAEEEFRAKLEAGGWTVWSVCFVWCPPFFVDCAQIVFAAIDPGQFGIDVGLALGKDVTRIYSQAGTANWSEVGRSFGAGDTDLKQLKSTLAARVL